MIDLGGGDATWSREIVGGEEQEDAAAGLVADVTGLMRVLEAELAKLEGERLVIVPDDEGDVGEVGHTQHPAYPMPTPNKADYLGAVRPVQFDFTRNQL